MEIMKSLIVFSVLCGVFINGLPVNSSVVAKSEKSEELPLAVSASPSSPAAASSPSSTSSSPSSPTPTAEASAATKEVPLRTLVGDSPRGARLHVGLPAGHTHPVYYAGIARVNGRFGKNIRFFTTDEFEKYNLFH